MRYALRCVVNGAQFSFLRRVSWLIADFINFQQPWSMQRAKRSSMSLSSAIIQAIAISSWKQIRMYSPFHPVHCSHIHRPLRFIVSHSIFVLLFTHIFSFIVSQPEIDAVCFHYLSGLCEMNIWATIKRINLVYCHMTLNSGQFSWKSSLIWVLFTLFRSTQSIYRMRIRTIPNQQRQKPINSDKRKIENCHRNRK